jgi:uncharacterized membrane protein YhhN
MPAILAAAAAAAVLAILSAEMGWKRMFYATKPLPTLLILAQAALAVPQGSPARIPLLIALTFCLVGDILLMLPHGSFRAGMAAFLLAHLAFITALASRLDALPSPSGLLVVLALAGLLILALREGLGHYVLPVAVYTAVLAATVWTAWGGMVSFSSPPTRLAFVGASLFFISDAILAVRRFRGPFPAGQLLTLGAYYPALALITLSFSTGL